MNSLNDGTCQTLRALAAQMMIVGTTLLEELAERDETARLRDHNNGEFYSLDHAWTLSWGTPVPRRPGEVMD